MTRDGAWTPRRVDSVDIAALPLSPVDAFVLSQLDGVTELDEIAVVTGLDAATLRVTLHRLEQLGAVHVRQDPDTSGSRRRHDPRRDDDEPVENREERVATAVRAPQRHARLAPPPPAPPHSQDFAERTEDDGADLDATQRERIDQMFARLDVASHYGLLGVDRDAEKKAIKGAYYALIPVFHPDKFFGRSLGSYKKKLEKIFERLTEAESVLTRKSSRADYDRYLEARRETHSFDAVLTSIPPPPVSQPTVATTAEPDAAPPGPAPQPEPEPAASVDPAVAAEARSRALARRLTVRRRNPRAPDLAEAKVVTPPPSADPRGRASDSLRRFLDGCSPRVDTFVKAGEEALASGSWVSAVNALRIAVNLAPDDDGIRALYDQANAAAQRHLATRYEATATYEEKNNHWEQAAQSWQRVAAARPEDPVPRQRAAECLLHTPDPRHGLKPAREAVQLAPDVLDYRLTLVRAYEASELLASAIGELGRAIEKYPDNAELRTWLRRLEKR